ncbi:hypothetical protein [Selenomonas ruminantium]|uniref:Uncharacterized protein n=1 Tax=Selenomonas ruminantium TaxID=971 RepID=A0A1H3ZHX8_SELRU|nr:hypothetical protein [Selenomonas ruminantium]SEA23265.1 hypothetical protein SAMN05660648_02438 [Selenomonas ruminantium]
MAFEFSVFDAYSDGDNIWFVAIEYNALWRKSLIDDTLEYVGSFPNENMFQWRLYTSVCEHDGKLYFIPASAYEIGVYDMVEKKFSKINIGIDKEENDVSEIRYAKKYISAFIIDNKLVMLPCCYDKVVVYDLVTEEMQTDSSMVEALREKYTETITSAEGVFYLCWNARRIDKDSVIFDLHSNANKFVKYNVRENVWEEYEAGEKKFSYNYIEYHDGEVWLYDDKKMLLVNCSMRSDAYKIFNLPITKGDMLISNMFVYGDCLYFLSASGESVIRFSIKDRTFEYVEELVSKELSFSSVAVKNNNRLCLYAPMEQSFVLYQDNKWRFLPCEINQENMIRVKDKAYLEMRQDGKGIVTEGMACGIEDFMRVIQYEGLLQRENNKNDISTGLSGRRIYDYLINEN